MNIWLNGKGEDFTVHQSGFNVSGLAGKWETSGSVKDYVFSGEIHFNPPFISDGMGALIGEIEGQFDGLAELTNCVAATSRNFPFIGTVIDTWRYVSLSLTNCITDYTLVGNMNLDIKHLSGLNDCSIITIKGCIYGSQDIFGSLSYNSETILSIEDNVRCDTKEMMTNGHVCYTINNISCGRYFTQTFGTDKVPYPNKSHARVYRVKQYTKCGSDYY